MFTVVSTKDYRRTKDDASSAEELMRKLKETEDKLNHYMIRAEKQSQIIGNVISIGKSKEEKASKNFNKVVSNLITPNAKVTLLRKLLEVSDNETKERFKEILENSIVID